MAILMYLNPFALFRYHVQTRVEAFMTKQYLEYRKKTEDGVNSAKELFFRASFISLIVTAIIWISIFMYVVFYYTYMPNVTHVRPVHLQFKSCDELAGVCSFPSAHVQLTKRSHMLMPGQPYQIKLILDMPESPVNLEMGMFMVCAQMRAKGGVLVSSSCRSAMMRHRSILHQILRTIAFGPLLVGGVTDERQQLEVELFSDFEDDQSLPATDAYVEVQSRHAQVYASELRVAAHFAGARYLMYHWPKLSALVGISTNLFFVSLVFILSWYHLQDGLPDFVKTKFGAEVKPKEEEFKTEFEGKVKLERDDSSAFFEDESLMEELKHLDDPVS